MEKVHKEIKIDKKWIEDNIIKPGWQRDVYPSRVNKFVNYIRNGTFQKSTITVAKDKESGKLMLLDGQHKIEAIKKSNTQFVMDFCIYNGLNDEGMRIIYKMLNDVKNPRIIDDIKLYFGRNEILDSFLDNKKFPINITRNGGVNSMRVDKFLSIVYCSNIMAISRQGISRNKLPKLIESLDVNKYIEMKEFFFIYKECFGEPTNDNWLYKYILLITMVRVWKANKDLFSNKEIIDSFKKLEGNSMIRQESYGVDNISLERLTSKVYQVINKGRQKKFIIFWDEDILV
jgi:hypothetical protein